MTQLVLLRKVWVKCVHADSETVCHL